MADPHTLRNFSIIAHIDHGKSTLADRLLERTGVVTAREAREQLLDDMDLERERGITIKARAVSLPYVTADGAAYTLNLIDTPGHVDFSYEVSRSLKACEGALLVVDAAQGVEAQTVANYLLALEQDLTVIPVLNKVDLAAARVDEVTEELVDHFGIEPDEVLQVSAKSGEGVEALLEAIVARVPAPTADPESPLRALIFDAVFDDYRGVVVYLRIVDGTIRRRDTIAMLATSATWEVLELGTFRPSGKLVRETLGAGEVGYLICNIKTLEDVKIGDTIAKVGKQEPKVTPLPGFRQPQPMVFCGLYPTNNAEFESLRKALDKLALNDSSFIYAPESSDALGFGFRCGFLGLLHMEVAQERLERESQLDLVQTAPTVTYRVATKSGKVTEIHSPTELPDWSEIDYLEEPVVRNQMIMPAENVGAIMQLAEERRGRFVNQEYLSKTRVILTYDLPLAEILYDFYDKLKSATRGYGTMDYELTGYQKADLVQVRILINGQSVDALSSILHREHAELKGRRMLIRLRREIPRQQFLIPLQAAIGGKIIARENIKGVRKDVTAKCYGGDVTRKRKLLEKQRVGKRRMKAIANVEVPQKAFMSVLAFDEVEEREKKKK